MPDFNKPDNTQAALPLLASIVENNQAALQWLEGVTPLTNLPVGAKRWNAVGAKFETWNGTVWGDLAALYEIKVRNSDQLNGQVDTFYRNAANLNAGILLGDRFNDSSHGIRAGGTLHAQADAANAGFMSSGHYNKLQGIEAGATGDQTAAEILTLMTTVDGAGSGLDADLVDGWHRDDLRARANHTGTQDFSTTITGRNFSALAGVISIAQIPAATAGNYTEGNEITGSIDGTFYGAMQKVPGDIYISRSGTFRARLKMTARSGNVTVRIYVNGNPVGTSRANPTLGTWFSDDIGVSAGQLVQMYAQVGGGGDSGTVVWGVSTGNPLVSSPTF